MNISPRHNAGCLGNSNGVMAIASVIAERSTAPEQLMVRSTAPQWFTTIVSVLLSATYFWDALGVVPFVYVCFVNFNEGSVVQPVMMMVSERSVVVSL